MRPWLTYLWNVVLTYGLGMYCCQTSFSKAKLEDSDWLSQWSDLNPFVDAFHMLNKILKKEAEDAVQPWKSITKYVTKW